MYTLYTYIYIFFKWRASVYTLNITQTHRHLDLQFHFKLLDYSNVHRWASIDVHTLPSTKYVFLHSKLKLVPGLAHIAKSAKSNDNKHTHLVQLYRALRFKRFTVLQFEYKKNELMDLWSMYGIMGLVLEWIQLYEKRNTWCNNLMIAKWYKLSLLIWNSVHSIIIYAIHTKKVNVHFNRMRYFWVDW